MAASSARRRAGVVLGSLAIAVAVAAVLWGLRTSSAPQSSVRGDGDDRGAAMPARGPSPAVDLASAGPAPTDAGPTRAAEPPRDPDPDPEPERSSLGPEPSMGEVMADARSRVVDAVRPCWPGGAGAEVSHERVIVQHTLEIADGWAYAREVAVVSSDMQDEELRDCIVDHLTGLSWEAPGAPEVSRSVQTTISTRDLTQ